MTTRNFLFLLVAGCATYPDPTDEVVDRDVAALIAPCSPGQWCIETPPTAVAGTSPPLLHSVFAIAADNVFAVGSGGTIFHRNSDAWTAFSSGTTQNLFAVWASSASDVWAGGIGGVLLHFDGTAWSPFTRPGAPTSDINSVWGSSSTDVWFAGSAVATHWDGVAFKQFNLAGILLSVSGTGPKDVWLAGEDTQLHHFTGGTSFPVATPAPPTTSMFAVLALGPTDVWVTDITSGMETMHLGADNTWTPHGTGGANFSGLAARASNDIWGVGKSRVGHWDGQAWTVTVPFGSASLQSVSIADGNGWIVGGNALIAHQIF